jgi:SdpC family antimicrobial peptide
MFGSTSRSARRTGFAACVMLGVAVVVAHAAPVSATHMRFDGEAIFRAVFFRQGPVAQALAPVSTLLPSLPASAYDAARAAVLRDDPSFFVEFATEMQSRDPARVDRALNNAVTKVNQGLEVDSLGSRLAAARGLGNTTFVAVDVAGNGTVVVCDDSVNCGTFVITYTYSSNKPGANSRLMRERRALALSRAL